MAINAVGVPQTEAAAAGSHETVDRLLQTALAAEIPFLLARSRAMTSTEANRRLAGVDLKVRTYSVLSLSCSGKKPTQRELCGFLDLDPSQVVALVDELQNRGLVIREADPTDRRSRLVVGTPAGRRLLRRATAIIDQATEHSLAPLAPDERDTLRRLLTRMCFDA